MDNISPFGSWVLQRCCWLMSCRTLNKFIRINTARGLIALAVPFLSKEDRILARAIWKEGMYFDYWAFVQSEFPDDFEGNSDSDDAWLERYQPFNIITRDHDAHLEEMTRIQPDGNSLYFYIGYDNPDFYDSPDLIIIESGDRRLLEKHRFGFVEPIPRNPMGLEGFTDLVTLETLFELTRGLKPVGCNAWVGVDDSEFEACKISDASPLWFTPLPSPAGGTEPDDRKP
jgi:hypothetical protein